ncbi:MAG: hypothetical protein HYU66_19555 [Armatimonadetes bacterium]|nr:hypothetical protein [Armatimonadota bacterium]
MRSEYHTPDDLVAYLKGLLTEDETAALEARVAADQDLAIELERTRTVLQITAAASDEAVTGRVNGYLERAIAGRASDIHLDLVRDGAVVRPRACCTWSTTARWTRAGPAWRG